LTTPSRGLGAAPFGRAAYAYGSPAVAPEVGGVVYGDELGVRRGSRKIVFGDNSVALPFRTGGKYEYDEKGRVVGAPDVEHLVTLAALMVKGSSAVPELGNRFYEARHVTPNLQQEQEANVNEAFGSLVAQGFISIESVKVEPNNGMPCITRILIRDLTRDVLLDELTI
jgi:hypothetical protein